MQNPQLTHLLALLSIAGLWVVQPAALRVQQAEESSVEKHLADARFAPIPAAPDCFLAVIEHGQPEKEASVMMMKARPKTLPYRAYIFVRLQIEDGSDG